MVWRLQKSILTSKSLILLQWSNEKSSHRREADVDKFTILTLDGRYLVPLKDKFYANPKFYQITR